VQEWDSWQEEHFENLLDSTYLPNPRRIIFQDEETRLFRGRRMDTMDLLCRGTLRLSAEGIIFAPLNGEEMMFSLAEISGPGVLKWNFFEFYVGKTVYRAKFSNRADSGRKYAVGLSLLARLTAR
jgi:hypothetical protein